MRSPLASRIATTALTVVPTSRGSDSQISAELLHALPHAGDSNSRRRQAPDAGPRLNFECYVGLPTNRMDSSGAAAGSNQLCPVLAGVSDTRAKAHPAMLVR